MDLPNIIYIHSHDTGRFVEPYGHAVPTPNMAAFAKQGVVFRNAFAAAPTCSPSRAALLTGQCPHRTGMLGLAHRGFSLDDPGRHLAAVLGAVGYETALAGIEHTGSAAAYHRILADSHKDLLPARAAAGFLQQQQVPQRRFFLDVGFFETHREFPDADPQTARWCRPPALLPDVPAVRSDWAGYLASAARLDEGVGMVLEAIDRAGLAERSIVILTTDHGPAFPHYKCNLTAAGSGVMLMLRGPEGLQLRGGRTIEGLVSQIDIFPTLCQWLGLEPPPWLEGRSLVPLIEGEAEQVNEQVFGEVSYHAAYEPQRAARTPRYSYIRRYGDRDRPVLPNCDDSPSKEVLLEHGWAARPQPREALYDLIFDPAAGHNIAADPAAADALADMRRRLDAWMHRTDDPLLRGPVAAPRSAEVNAVDGLSPREPTHTVA